MRPAAGRCVTRVEGRGLPLPGHDIDTDRIVPARFLKTVSFEGLERHLFEDDRAAWPSGQGHHPFADPAYAGAAVLIVNRNFGCGSSREHAPQAIYRWGIRAIVGESFSEIFFGNALALGLPCVTLDVEAAAELQRRVAAEPATLIRVDLGEACAVSAGRSVWRASMPTAAREALTSGGWDATGMLLENLDEVDRLASRLPYVSRFTG